MTKFKASASLAAPRPKGKVGEKGMGVCSKCGKRTVGKSNDLCSRCGGTPVHMRTCNAPRLDLSEICRF